MFTKFILPLLAALGFWFASYSVVSSNKAMPIAPAVTEPATTPFAAFIAGAGIIEPQNQAIAIGTPLSRIVKKVAVKVGDTVKTGTPLFYLDDQDTQAELASKLADLAKAQADYAVAKAAYSDTLTLSNLAEGVSDKRAISQEELLKRRNALHINKTRIDSAKALIQQAQASVNNIQNTLDRLVIRAPSDSEVLQVNIRAGEFAQAGALSTPLMLLGNLQQLHVRVDIDENDAWRFNKTSKAMAYLRGNRNFKVDLTLAYVEPFVIPKKSLTGDSTERVDSRVLQALYRFEKQEFPVYVGQQMDVFIEVPNAVPAISSLPTLSSQQP